jgi:hypothetical protein
MKCKDCKSVIEAGQETYDTADTAMTRPLCSKCLLKGTEAGTPAGKTTTSKRTIKNPARYELFNLIPAGQIGAETCHSDTMVMVPCGSGYKGPAIARKAVIKDRIAGNIACFRGPVWREQYGVQEVFGAIEEA